MMHPVKQESNSQLEYPPAWGEQASYTGHPCEYTSEEDLEEEPEKQVEVPKRTGKRGRPPSATSKAAAKRKGTQSNYTPKYFNCGTKVYIWLNI